MIHPHPFGKANQNACPADLGSGDHRVKGAFSTHALGPRGVHPHHLALRDHVRWLTRGTTTWESRAFIRLQLVLPGADMLVAATKITSCGREKLTLTFLPTPEQQGSDKEMIPLIMSTVGYRQLRTGLGGAGLSHVGIVAEVWELLPVGSRGSVREGGRYP